MLNFSKFKNFFSEFKKKSRRTSKKQLAPLRLVKNLTNLKRLLTLAGWRQFFKILTKKERIAFFVFSALVVGNFCFLIINFYFKNTEIQPARGGSFIEGEIGQPRFINPVYAQLSDVDRDLVELIFSGLMKYSPEGKVIPDLAKDHNPPISLPAEGGAPYKILEGGKIYEFYLKENIFWSDGSPLTAEDLIFTIETIQNPDYKSPIRASFVGVEVERISDLGVRFKLKNPSGPFLESLTLKIIPKHIWKDISPQNFPLSIYNLKPVGCGPYKLKSLKQGKDGKIISLDLVRNKEYFGQPPNLSQISFKFFDNEEQLIRSYKKGEIQGFSLGSDPGLTLNSAELYNFSLPRYFAVFFNPDNSKILDDPNVRKALNYGTNKEEIVEKVLKGNGRAIHSPILPEIYGFQPPSEIYQFDPEKAKDLLEKSEFFEKETGPREKIIKKEPAFQFKSDLQLGSKGQEVNELQKCLSRFPEVYPEGEITGVFGNLTKSAVIRFQEKYKEDILEPWGFKEGTGLVRKTTRAKLNEVCFKPPEETLPLKFSLLTVDQSSLIEVADLLKNQWQVLGVEVEIKTFDISTFEKDIIKKREYESLLFGEVLGAIPDPFPFWHSVQKKDPGLNLAIYQNKKADALLEEARQCLNETERKEKLEDFQDILIKDAPCVFLYSPDFIYLVSKEIKGINAEMIVDPSKRFSDIENWYIKTKRVWK